MFHISLSNVFNPTLRHLLPLIMLSFLSSCLEEEKKANLLFFHDAPTFGLLDVVVNNQVLDQVDPNQFGKNVGLDVGNNDIDVKIGGESTALASVKINAQSQQYVLVFRGDQSEMNQKLIPITATPGSEVDPTQHYIEILNLSDSETGMNVFVEDQNIATNPTKGSVSQFLSVTPGTQVKIGITDIESESPLVLEKHNLNPNAFSLLLIYTVEKQNELETKFKLIEITDLNNSN